MFKLNLDYTKSDRSKNRKGIDDRGMDEKEWAERPKIEEWAKKWRDKCKSRKS